VSTNWNGGSGGVTGQSERITVFSSTGAQVSQQVVNLTGGTSVTTLSVPTGAYTVRVELNSAANFGGAVTGVLQTATTSGSSSLNIAVGATPQSIRVSPTTADLTVGSTLPLSVAGVDAGGNLTFLAPNSVTYTSTGDAVSVATTGVVTGATAGTSVVTVHGPNASVATSTINVQRAGVTRSKWTVMVFLNAANNLYPYATPNVNQMERVAYNSDVRFVVQWKESRDIFGLGVHHNGTQRYLVKPDTGGDAGEIKSQLVQDLGTNTDMGSATTLHDFVAWTKENYPADRYVLIIWNHGNGWQRSPLVAPPVRAVSYDDQFNSYIDIWDLPSALQGEHVDILSFDACLMQMLEIASELKDSASYLASSEENTPGPGYPYDRIFKKFADSPNTDTRAISKAFVDGHVGYEPYQNLPITQSVIDSSKVTPVETALDALAGALLAERANITSVIPTIRSSMTKYASPNDGHFYYDLVDLCEHLKANAGIPASVKTAATAVIAAVGVQGGPNAVVWNGFTSRSAFSRGIAIDFSPSTGGELSLYGNLNLAKTTRWDEWLKVAP
jgi:hypothetical protein